MQAIADWLKNGTYEQGVQLYVQHGSNSFLKTKFGAGANDYNVAKLREELEKLVGSGQWAVSSDVALVVETASAAPPTSTPDQAKKYLQLTNKKTKLYLSLNVLMEQKHHVPEGEDLRKCAAAILSHHQQLTETWAAIDYYQEHGRFPEDDVPVKADLPIKKEMQLLRQTISKAKKRLAGTTCRDREQTETLLAVSRNKLARLVESKKTSHDK